MSRVLIVEDSKMLCKIMRELLEKYTTFDFDIANTYKKAEEFLHKHHYDFSVVDLHLPDMWLKSSFSSKQTAKKRYLL